MKAVLTCQNREDDREFVYVATQKIVISWGDVVYGVQKDDQETMLSKIVYGLAHERELEMIEFFQKHIALVPLKRIFTFSGKNRCFIYTLAAYFLKPHLREKCVLRDVPITFDFDANFVMPDYVYDKHVHGGTKGYAFFVNNIVMIPVEPESEVAREAKKICIESECNTGHWLSELAKKT